MRIKWGHSSNKRNAHSAYLCPTDLQRKIRNFFYDFVKIMYSVHKRASRKCMSEEGLGFFRRLSPCFAWHSLRAEILDVATTQTRCEEMKINEHEAVQGISRKESFKFDNRIRIEDSKEGLQEKVFTAMRFLLVAGCEIIQNQDDLHSLRIISDSGLA